MPLTGTRHRDPQRFAAALLKLVDRQQIGLEQFRDPQRFAAALLKLVDRQQIGLEQFRDPQRFAAALLKQGVLGAVSHGEPP